jgi:uncharacterized protein YdhG (YjbR/CyaY superfamily)
MPSGATEVISYSILGFRRERVLVWIAAFANHCSLFPTAAVIEAFKADLAGFTVSKGTVQFPLDRPLPVALVKKLVKARIARDESKTRNHQAAGFMISFSRSPNYIPGDSAPAAFAFI